MLENEYRTWKFTRQFSTMPHLTGEQLDFKQQIVFGKMC